MLRQLRGAVPRNRDRVASCDVRQTAREVHRLAEDVPAHRDRRSVRDAAVQLDREVARSGPRLELQPHPHAGGQVLGDVHGGITDELHDPSAFGSRDLESAGLEGVDEIRQLVGPQLLRQLREADDVDEADRGGTHAVRVGIARPVIGLLMVRVDAGPVRGCLDCGELVLETKASTEGGDEVASPHVDDGLFQHRQELGGCDPRSVGRFDVELLVERDLYRVAEQRDLGLRDP